MEDRVWNHFPFPNRIPFLHIKTRIPPPTCSKIVGVGRRTSHWQITELSVRLLYITFASSDYCANIHLRFT